MNNNALGMLIQGGGNDAAQEFVKALNENTRETGGLSKVFSKAAGGAQLGAFIGGPAGAAFGVGAGAVGGLFDATVGRAVNTAASITTTFAENAAQSFVQRSVRFGSGPSANLANSLVDAGTKIPIIGGLIQNAVSPFQNAQSRLGAIAGSIAAAGGQVSDAEMQQNAQFLIAQEQRRREAERRVDELFETDTGISARKTGAAIGEIARARENFKKSGLQDIATATITGAVEGAAAYSAGVAAAVVAPQAVAAYFARYLGD